MSTGRGYRARRRSTRAEATRAKIVAAVGELLAEGTFHEATVDQVAERAGIARATLYQHFRSRLELVDAVCDTFAQSPALIAIRQSIVEAEPSRALTDTIRHSVTFWSSGDAAFAQLYGVTAIDPAAQDFVDRQRSDRRSELERLVGRLRSAGLLRDGLTDRKALAELMLLTSYGTFLELRHAGLSDREIARTLHDATAALVTG
jgi:AcrR family transcriptional regulator